LRSVPVPRKTSALGTASESNTKGISTPWQAPSSPPNVGGAQSNRYSHVGAPSAARRVATSSAGRQKPSSPAMDVASCPGVAPGRRGERGEQLGPDERRLLGGEEALHGHVEEPGHVVQLEGGEQLRGGGRGLLAGAELQEGGALGDRPGEQAGGRRAREQARH